MTMNVTDIIFIVIGILICIYSFHQGFLKRIRSFIAAAVAGIADYFVFQYLKQFKFTKNYYIGIILLICFIILFLVVKWIISTIAKDVKETPIIGTADRLFGLLIGIIQSAILIVIVSLIIYTVSKEYALSSVVISYIVKFLKV